ncbi:MAG: hypothetical protein B5M53_02845 [Candidatus Cloacimonas sp. 4484_209]|nr:MAG: hypothetical protein B5M53_02845 [Candidatus Cloacimonas sp. 4484_209]
MLNVSSFGESNHPQFIKGIYINKYIAGNRPYMISLQRKFGYTINTLVIDIKDSHGTLSYRSKLKLVKQVGAQGTSIKNLKNFVKRLKANGYYLIGRIAVFRDPVFAQHKNNKFGVKIKGTEKLFKDENGFIWVDPFSKDAWKYNIAIAEEAAKAGFDEIQFDYTRFPSIGKESKIPYFPFKKRKRKEEVIVDFLTLAREKLKKLDVNISIVLFGYTLWRNYLPREGQQLNEIGKRVDFIYPILYPSHFADNFMKDKKKAHRTYSIIYESIKKGRTLLRHTDCKIIPYIQGFDWKQSKLGNNYIEVQMKASEDAGAEGWIVWNAKGEYDDTYTALLKHYTKIVVKPNLKPRTERYKTQFITIKDENQSKKSDTKGIDAMVCW